MLSSHASEKQSPRFNLSKRVVMVATAILGSVSALCVAGGFQLARSIDRVVLPEEVLVAWEHSLASQRAELEKVRAISEQELEAMTVRMAQLQAGLMRLDALGESGVLNAPLRRWTLAVRVIAAGGDAQKPTQHAHGELGLMRSHELEAFGGTEPVS